MSQEWLSVCQVNTGIPNLVQACSRQKNNKNIILATWGPSQLSPVTQAPALTEQNTFIPARHFAVEAAAQIDLMEPGQGLQAAPKLPPVRAEVGPAHLV